MELSELMKEIRDKYKNDSLTSRKLKISRQAIINICEGYSIPKDETVVKMCEELNLDKDKMIIKAHTERSKGEVRKIWEDIGKKLSNVAAALLVSVFVAPQMLALNSIRHSESPSG